MATTKVTIHDLSRQIQNTLARSRIKTLLDALTDAMDAGALVALSVTTAMLNDLAVTTGKIAANAVTGAKLAAVLCGAPTTRAGAGAVAITSPTCLYASGGAADALTVADGAYTGQRLVIVHIIKGVSGTGVITQGVTGAKLTAAIATITLNAAYDTVTLEWSGALWNPIAWSGTTAIVNT